MSNTFFKLPSLFVFLFLFLGIFGVYYLHPIIYGSQSYGGYIDTIYLISTLLSLSVAYHFLFMAVNGAEKKAMTSKTYDVFIPPSIVVAFIFFLPLDAIQSLKICYAYLLFFALGHIINDKKEVPHIILIQFAWLCIFSGLGFTIFPSFIIFFPILLVVCKVIYPKKIWLALHSVFFLYFTPVFVATIYSWLAEDYFPLFQYFTDLFILKWSVFEQAVAYFYSMNLFKQYYIIIFFCFVFAYFLVYSLRKNKNVVLNLLVLYCLLTLLFFVDSLDDFVWKTMNMVAILFTYVAIRTTYYRLVSVLIVMSVLLILIGVE